MNKRLFVGIELPAEVCDELDLCLQTLELSKADVGWVLKKNFHITLQFLGSTSIERIPEIQTRLKNAAVKATPFFIRLACLGAFPEPQYPKVVWAGVAEGSDDLKRLATLINQPAEKPDFREESRAFTPHVTLGRVRSTKNLKALSERLLKTSFVSPVTFGVREVLLYESNHGPSGPIYTVLSRYPFSI